MSDPRKKHLTKPGIAVIGGGPAGLMAAETLAGLGWSVEVYDGMPSVGRKFLLAGVGGMNITHSEPAESFIERYRRHQGLVKPWLENFDAGRLRDWVHRLGIETFVGSSGRVFPREMKAAPLLRAWLLRLKRSGVRIHGRHRWLGWDADGALRFRAERRGSSELEEVIVAPRAVILALGGASWSRLGSDGAWVPLMEEQGVVVSPLKPANCGFEVDWSPHFRDRFAGQPLKPVRVRHRPGCCLDLSASGGNGEERLGECMVSRDGLEGGVIYSLSAALRESLEQEGLARIELDLAPDQTEADLARALARPRGSQSMASHLRRRARLAGVKASLLREVARPEDWQDPSRLAQLIKGVPLTLKGTRPLDEAISTAGGIAEASLDPSLMLKAIPGAFCAGEMLDWEAPTGGYLLTACFASGFAAGHGADQWLRDSRPTGAV